MLVMGLGNPGNNYAGTRHNVGYRVGDLLMEEPPLQLRRRLFSSLQTAVLPSGEPSGDMILIRYAGYMNSSGSILPRVLKKYAAEPSDLIVVVDNMDLPPGSCRLRKGGGSAGHNGLKSIIANLGSSAFLRLYIGVGRPQDGETVVEHVLGRPSPEDADRIEYACRKAAEALRRLRSESFERVAEELNRRDT